MKKLFIVYLKNKTSTEFVYSPDVSSIQKTDKGYQIRFANGKKYNYGAEKVRYYPLISSQENVRIYEHGKLNEYYNAVDSYGDYLIFRNGQKSCYPMEKHPNLEICAIKTNIAQSKSILDYFKSILKISKEVSFGMSSDNEENSNPNQISLEILGRALDAIDIFDSRTAFSSYIDGKNPAHAISNRQNIFPFGCNESQKLAVETSLSNRISIIEGPPGTGKTQTILNIIANLIMQDKTVAIVANNNSSVQNILDKMNKYGYDMLVASLGNKDNKDKFFEALEEQVIPENFNATSKKIGNLQVELKKLDNILTKCFQFRNKVAILKTKLADAEIEFSHLQVEMPLDLQTKLELDKRFPNNLSSDRLLKLKDFVSAKDLKDKIAFIDKLKLIFQYRLFDFKFIMKYSDILPVYINHKFYDVFIKNIKNELNSAEKWLNSNDEKSNLQRFVEVSKEIFQAKVSEKYSHLERVEFNSKNYYKLFGKFKERYPVILSTTISLSSSIPNDFLFDYVIIDEATQVDIIKSSVCFSCSRNAIVVGDSMQLSHIVDPISEAASEQFLTANNISPVYNYVKLNILNSIKGVYGEEVKSVLLKEHYRCHPSIIGFCNKKYYQNKLVIMTSADNHPFRIIDTNVGGGMNRCNQRQIDETEAYIKERKFQQSEVGVIAPYSDHAVKLKKQLKNAVEADTIYKFQGREKDVIIFNTVKGEIVSFIDNPNLINVAVSRAIKEFIIVKSESMALPHGTNIGDLIRYIRYNSDPSETMVQGKIHSVFDLLYKEYSQQLFSFLSKNKNIKGSPAEIIIYKLLKDSVLQNNPQFLSIDMLREYRLRDLVRDYESLSTEEIQFIKKDSKIDFLLFNRLDKTPLLAIEVDGVAFHNNELQKERDSKKNNILDKIGLPLLRLSTNGHNEEARIIEKLNKVMEQG